MSYFFNLLSILLQIYWVIIFVRVILSWVSVDPYNPIVSFIYSITEPVLGAVRDVIPPVGGLDLSSLIVLVAISFLQQIFNVLAVSF